MPPKGFTKKRDDQPYAESVASAASRKRSTADTGFIIENAGLKRKRNDEIPGPRKLGDAEYVTKVNFATMPIDMLNAYLNKYDLFPPIYPSPASSATPPPPSHLVNPPTYIRREVSPTPSLTTGGITPANRPRRDPKRDREGSRRRSSRLLEEESAWRDMRNPILADIDEGHGAIATIAQRHFERQTMREGDVITGFVYAVKTRDRALKILPQ